MIAPPPMVVPGDAMAAVVALFVARHLLFLLLRRRPRRARRVAGWVRRIAVVALLLPVLRLVALAGWRPDQAGALLATAAAMLAAGGALLLLDRLVTARLHGPPEAPRRPLLRQGRLE